MFFIMSKPQRISARTKLLDATLRMVRQQGFAATSVDELCKAAGVTKGAFFHHFDSKEALGVAAADYWSRGFKRAAAEGFFNAYLVERGGSSAREGEASQRPDRARRSSSQIDGMNEVLLAGDSLIIFPEGTRGTGEKLARFQAGLYHLARKNPEIPVIPVALANLGRILPKGEKIPVPHLSTVRFHEPIGVGEEESKEEFLGRATAIINRSLRSFDPDIDDEPEPGEDSVSEPKEEKR